MNHVSYISYISYKLYTFYFYLNTYYSSIIYGDRGLMVLWLYIFICNQWFSALILVSSIPDNGVEIYRWHHFMWEYVHDSLVEFQVPPSVPSQNTDRHNIKILYMCWNICVKHRYHMCKKKQLFRLVTLFIFLFYLFFIFFYEKNKIETIWDIN